MLVVVAVSSVSIASTSSQEPPSDEAITAAVERALQFDRSIPANTITTATNEGIVTLGGSVDDLLERERATKAVQQVRGVRSVVNAIQVDAISRPNAEIENDVKEALRYDPATERYEILPHVDQGAVTLTGTVQSWQARNLAVHTAKSVRGVRSVHDSLTVKAPASRADDEIQADVEGALRINPWVDADLVMIEVSDGTVHLSGSVSSLAQRNIAEGAAWVISTRAVDTTGLAVNSWAEAATARRQPAAPTDAQIQSAVEAAIRLDPRISSQDIRVRVNEGMVTLSGVVHTLRAQNAAGNDARHAVGVRRVHNFLKIQSPRRAKDRDLSQTIAAALGRNSITDDLGIDVKARNGKIWLTGLVDTYFQKAEAERIAQGAAGVSSVHNRLQVLLPASTYYDYAYDSLWDYEPSYRGDGMPFETGDRPYTSDEQIADDIRAELFWSPFVDGDDVSVQVENGVATLSGDVSDWSEYRAATDNAYEAGAASVVNHLTVRSPGGS